MRAASPSFGRLAGIVVLCVTEKRKPGRTSRIRFWPVMNAQHTPDNVLIDLHTESQRDLLSNAGTTPAGITPFHCHDGLDEVSSANTMFGLDSMISNGLADFVGRFRDEMLRTFGLLLLTC